MINAIILENKNDLTNQNIPLSFFLSYIKNAKRKIK